jgi:hypothetical protein
VQKDESAAMIFHQRLHRHLLRAHRGHTLVFHILVATALLTWLGSPTESIAASATLKTNFANVTRH